MLDSRWLVTFSGKWRAAVACPEAWRLPRIRDAAIVRFGREGFGVGLRAIAGDAGVSAALVMRHFGSKDGLRTACDEHVTAVIRQLKAEGMQTPGRGSPTDVIARVATMEEYQPLIDYLLRALQEGSAATDALFDQMVADAEVYLEEGVASGMLTPTDDPRMRALVLTLMSFGPLLLGRHLGRHVGTDGYTAQAYRQMMVPLLELFTHGLFADPAFLAAMRAAAAPPSTPPTPQDE
jgi:AcrR family transcriptional regulator